jgi:hypothetical protein
VRVFKGKKKALLGFHLYVNDEGKLTIQTAHNNINKNFDLCGGIMKFRADESMKDYLKPTEFCDCRSNEIQQKAEELTKSAGSPKEAAKNIFYFVRDQCLFAVGRSDVKASETLKTKEGYCVTKTNL